MLPPITRIADTVPLYYPLDPAIDFTAVDPEFWADYCAGRVDAFNVDRIPLLEGEKPTIFHVRPLRSRERQVAESLAYGDLRARAKETGVEPTREEQVLAGADYLSLVFRMGLVRLENAPDGFEFGRVERYGVALWDDGICDALESSFAFLARAILDLGAVPLGRTAPSGSKPGAESGTSTDEPTRAAQSNG